MGNPVLVIHGGAGWREGQHTSFADYAAHLRAIVTDIYPLLQAHGSRTAVREAVSRLEDDPLFNAGTGARLQRDGTARLSAALMDSANQQFAGVINVERIQHPVALADRLAGQAHRVLAGSHAREFAHASGLPDYDPVTEHRLAEHQRRVAGHHGTVGAVACDANAVLAAATSTGGVGYERPGRVSDTATVAGTYASTNAAVSVTGQGEQIVDHAVAARIVTRVDDGQHLQGALDKTFAEAQARDLQYGVIAVDRRGYWAASQTPAVTTLYASCSGDGAETFLPAIE